MSGHSKWSTIKHKKGAADAKRGKMFTKIIKEITVAAKLGGGDEEANPRLRTAIIKAKAANMPKDNIARAIKKGTGDLGGVEYLELTYEGYAPGGIALLIMTLTDNKNRTVSDVKSTLTKSNGSLGTSGSVSYMFARKGVVTVSGDDLDSDAIFEAVLEVGADDVDVQDGFVEISCEPDVFEDVVKALEGIGVNPDSAEVEMVPDSRLSLDNDTTNKVLRLIDRLEDLDDVQAVYSNLDIPDDFVPED